MEVVFARGTVTPEHQKKVPLTQTQEEDHAVDGDFLFIYCIQVLKSFISYLEACTLLLSLFLLFPEDTALKYRYETKYRTATIMEEDALNKPSAAGQFSIESHFNIVVSHSKHRWSHVACAFFVFFLAEADLSLHLLSESPCGSLVIYVIPESSLLLPQVKKLLTL